MNNDDVLFAIAIAVFSPLLGCLATTALRRVLPARARCGPALFASGISLLAGCWVALQVFVPRWTPQGSQILFQWIRASSVFPLDVALSVYVDELTALLLVLVPFLAMVLVLDDLWRTDEQRRSWKHFAASMLLVFAVLGLIVSSQLLVLLAFWQLISVSVYLLASAESSSTAGAIAARRLFLVHFAADLVLALALFLMWNMFGSLDVSVTMFRSDAFEFAMRDNPAKIVTICVCIFFAVSLRTAQFPVTAWLDELAPLSDSAAALAQSVAAMPAAIYLMFRCSTLVAASPYAQILMAFVGTLTLVMAAIVAANANSARQALAFDSAGRYGLLLLGIGTGLPAGLTAAIFALVVHSCAKTSLLIAAGDARAWSTRGTEIWVRRSSAAPIAFLVGSLALVVDILGSATILTACQFASVGKAAARSTLFGESPGSLYGLLYWMAVGGTSLLTFALFRAFFLGFRGLRRNGDSANWGGVLPLALPLIAACVAGPALKNSGYFRRFLAWVVTGPAENLDEVAFTVKMSGALSFAAASIAWLLFARPRSPRIERIARIGGPFIRLGQRRMYLPDVFFFLLVLPIRGAAQFSRFLDWLVMGGLFETLPRKIPGWIVRASRSLQTGVVQFYALALAVAAFVLTIVFSGFTG